jgi:hypothetical protein
VVDKKRGKHARPGFSAWERKLVFVIARKFELYEPEELQAELARTVLDLKARPPPAISDWKNYLAKALHNRANNWVRDRRNRAKRETALPESGEETSSSSRPARQIPSPKSLLQSSGGNWVPNSSSYGIFSTKNAAT